MFKPETLKAGLKVSVLFWLGFVLLGEPLAWSLFLAALGGIAGGFLFAGWKSTELPSLPSPSLPAKSKREEKTILAEDIKREKRQQRRRQPRNSWFFWKNSRSPKRRR